MAHSFYELADFYELIQDATDPKGKQTGSDSDCVIQLKKYIDPFKDSVKLSE